MNERTSGRWTERCVCGAFLRIENVELLPVREEMRMSMKHAQMVMMPVQDERGRKWTWEVGRDVWRDLHKHCVFVKAPLEEREKILYAQIAAAESLAKEHLGNFEAEREEAGRQRLQLETRLENQVIERKAAESQHGNPSPVRRQARVNDQG